LVWVPHRISILDWHKCFDIMEEVKLNLNEAGDGYFYIVEDNEVAAELVISLSGQQISAHHTEVYPKGEGKGLGKKLLAGMADYARKNDLKIVALCPFVHAQFKRHPETYEDVMSHTI
jgi:uncharacterized protein